MRFAFTTQVLGLIAAIVIASSAYGAWAPTPDPKVKAADGFGSDLAFSPRFVAPSQEITFPIQSVEDEDTNCLEKDKDPNVEAKIAKTGGTVQGTWASRTFSGATYITYTVPANAQEGQTIELAFQAYDTREASDPRHDQLTTVRTYDFTVRQVYPATLTVDNTQDTTGTVPVNETLGKATVRMVAGGTPPEGEQDWNGTVFTESLGNFAGTVADLTPTAVQKILGAHPNEGYDSSFTVGTAAINKFDDYLKIWQDYIILKDGVNTTDITHDHDYVYGVQAEFEFLGTYEMTREAGPRVKGELALEDSGD